MWPSTWLKLKSQRRIRPDKTRPTGPTRSYSTGFSCSSFKDVHTLLQPEPEPQPASPKSLFRRLRATTSLLRSSNRRTIPTSSVDNHHSPPPPQDSDASSVVVYYTSLRVVRRTFDDCCAVRSILRGFPVAVDERDVSIDDRFRDEIHAILGRRNSAAALPIVFIGGVYVGGADDIRRLYESGELQKMIERLPSSKPHTCDFCGGLRFVVCDECDGSHKIYTEKSGFRSCTSCNTYGLIRCHVCYFVLPRHTK